MTEQTKRTKTYEEKMADLDAKIRAARQRKKKLKKDHEVTDLKLKLSKQSEQIAQLTADNQQLKAKLADTDMQTVPFPADKKLSELAQEKADLSKKLAEQKRYYAMINNKYAKALMVIRDLGKQYDFDSKSVIDEIKAVKDDSPIDVKEEEN